MNEPIHVRKAARQDAGDLAILDNIASHGLSLWLWFGVNHSKTVGSALEQGRERMLDDSQPSSFHNAYIGEIGGVTAGMSLGYGVEDAILSGSLLSIDPVLRPIIELFSLCQGKWLVDGLAVYNNSRHQGVAHELLEHQFKLATLAGYSDIVLVAEDSNKNALDLYEAFGFKTIDRRTYVPFNDTATSREWLLMQAPTHTSQRKAHVSNL